MLILIFHRSTESTSCQQPSIPLVPDTVTASHKKRKRENSCGDELDTALLKRLEGLQQQQDGEAAFGEHVASCLRQMNPRQRALARIEIDKVILNIQFPEDSYSNDPYYTFN